MQRSLISLIFLIAFAVGACAPKFSLLPNNEVIKNLETYYSVDENRVIDGEVAELTYYRDQILGAVMQLALGIAGDEEAIRLFKERVLNIAKQGDYLSYILAQIEIAVFEGRLEDAKMLVKAGKEVQDKVIEEIKKLVPEMNEYWEAQQMKKKGI